MERLADGRGGRSREQRDRENTEKEAKPQAETTVTNGTRPSSLRQRWRARARGTDGPRGMLPRLGERSSAGGAGCRREPNSGWSRRAKKKGEHGGNMVSPMLTPPCSVLRAPAHLLGRRSTCLVHLAASLVEPRRARLGGVDRDLAGLELLSLLDKRSRFRQPAAKLFRPGISARSRIPAAAGAQPVASCARRAQFPVGDSPRDAQGPEGQNESSPHEADATLAPLPASPRTVRSRAVPAGEAVQTEGRRCSGA